ncbi:MAG: nicotinamide-nucleotide amidohydrolase family protein [Spirochaetaceae bacterium]|jgi:PncC family amidohydrolase|nr:nicotinamide-nucleotide amidohydrolase family protein [Spirochaetaceae bacterium]
MDEIITRAEELIHAAAGKGLRIALAESCTGGLVSNLLAGVSGASRVLWGAYIVYTPEAKTAMLGVDPAIIKEHGAVSRETALALAEGALRESGADIAASVTGLAGPGGDGSGKPVGTVFMAGVRRAGGSAESREYHFIGSRNGIRCEAAWELIALLLRLSAAPPG